MFFTKYPHPANFIFAESYDEKTGRLKVGDRSYGVTLRSHEGGVFHIQVADKSWGKNLCLAPLTVPKELKGTSVKMTSDAGFVIRSNSGAPLLKIIPGQGIGFCGQASIFQVEVSSSCQFYGMGEKNFGVTELSGLRTKFWNTDVWSDFHFTQWMDHAADPPYFSTPYVIVHTGEEYVGLLLHNPYPTFISTPGKDDTRVFVEWQRTSDNLILGSEGGEPNLWIITGPSLREVTQKLQKLVGVTPLPPIWALGYHQSRWEYGSEADLVRLDEAFSHHKIPCDALWLDIDYMDEFRVFTTDKKAFPSGISGLAKRLQKNGRRIVPILDPGVKLDPGYEVYDDGMTKNVFCKSITGRNFVGLVWPGETVFPDFSAAKVRKWWSAKVTKFAREGYGASWLDMNDPSTGPVDPTGMRFRNGQLPHEAHHNQYALGMQMASRDGFQRARPSERPFLLSRSGFIGSSLYSAIWTGDNLSSYHYLKMCIPTSLGLSLSGLPFNGPDVGGFGGDVTDQLMLDWVKTCFLFPFMRNHSMKDSRNQEPWEFPAKVTNVLRHYIRLRYKMLPYLYNLFIQQEEHGDPILRPLIYEVDDRRFSNCNDMFMVGPDILQAPIVDEKKRSRDVMLPKGEWFDATVGKWVKGTQSVKPARGETPLYFRNGAIVAMQNGSPATSKKNLKKIELHVFCSPDSPGESSGTYHADDGLSFKYQTGARTSVSVRCRWDRKGLTVDLETLSEGFGPLDVRIIAHGHDSITVNGLKASTKPTRVKLCGSQFQASEVSL